MNDQPLSFSQAITSNLEKANKLLADITTTKSSTDQVTASMAVANAFIGGALVAAVQELTDEIRKHREDR